jgi:hypothetical protein
MTRGSDGPEDVDATFAEIVADLRADGFGLPEDVDSVDEASTTAPDRPIEPPSLEPPETGWRGGGTAWDTTMFSDDPAEDDEHYVPPEPPPLPRPKMGAVLILLLFLSGLFLLIGPQLIGVGTTVATPLGILALATAIALLLLRVRQGPPPGADPSNGAQI